jgi:hypothetical protein
VYDVDVIRITASSSAKYLWSLGQWHLLSILLLGLRLKVRRRYRTEGFDKESRSIQRLIFGTHRYPWPSFQTCSCYYHRTESRSQRNFALRPMSVRACLGSKFRFESLRIGVWIEKDSQQFFAGIVHCKEGCVCEFSWPIDNPLWKAGVQIVRRRAG